MIFGGRKGIENVLNSIRNLLRTNLSTKNQAKHARHLLYWYKDTKNIESVKNVIFYTVLNQNPCQKRSKID